MAHGIQDVPAGSVMCRCMCSTYANLRKTEEKKSHKKLEKPNFNSVFGMTILSYYHNIQYVYNEWVVYCIYV